MQGLLCIAKHGCLVYTPLCLYAWGVVSTRKLPEIFLRELFFTEYTAGNLHINRYAMSTLHERWDESGQNHWAIKDMQSMLGEVFELCTRNL